MPDITDRLALPLLAAGQAQKEVTHNEALTLIDCLVQAVVVAVAPTSVPVSPLVGQGWIVGASPTGAWSGKAHHLAVWTSGGWRFASPVEGMAVWSVADQKTVRRSDTGWATGTENAASYAVNGVPVVGNQQPAVATPTDGETVDSEARVAIAAVIAALRTHGLIAT